MIDTINLPLILAAAFLASASPGPATLAIADTAMQQGRRIGLALAAGVTTGSILWSAAAALGLGALMLANAWAAEVLRYLGAAYLMLLALRSARAALAADAVASEPMRMMSPARAYFSGLALHLTNPKAILFFGSLYSIGISPETAPADLALVIGALGLQSLTIFHGYALLFSNRRIVQGYGRLRRWFQAAFALAFGAASLRILTARLQ
jgi:threonine/homoserine/homoserine lactone efflux protein